MLFELEPMNSFSVGGKGIMFCVAPGFLLLCVKPVYEAETAQEEKKKYTRPVSCFS